MSGPRRDDAAGAVDIEQQNRATEAVLGAWPGRDALAERLERFVVDARLAPPARSGATWFRMATASSGRTVIEQAADIAGPWTLVFDPGSVGEGKAIDWFKPSRDGALVAVGVSTHGDEQSVVHVVDASTGDVGDERLPFASFGSVVWLPDSSGFYYTAGETVDTERYEKFVFFHEVGSGAPPRREPVVLRDPTVAMHGSEDGRFVMVLIGECAWRTEWIKNLETGEWTPFLSPANSTANGVFVGDAYIAVTRDGAPRGRLVRIPLATPDDPRTWTELIAESDAVLIGVQRFDGGLIVHELVDAFSRVRVVALDGSPVADVVMPGDGVAQLSPTTSSDRDLYFSFSSLSSSPALYRYSAGSVEEIQPPAVVLEDVVVTRRDAVSSDGVRVPYVLIHGADVDLSTPTPTLLWGYGGFNIPASPAYRPEIAAFVDSGGVWVHSFLRGGGEFGQEWWEAGRRERKQQTFDDLYAVAADLVASGVTTNDRLAVQGASNGGLMVGVAVTQRPELWGAAVALVPVMDLFDVQRVPYLHHDTRFDWGDADDPVEAGWLRGYSPAQNVTRRAYPPTFIGCGANDIRTPPEQGAVLAKLLQEHNTADTPIVLRVFGGAGHTGGTTRSAAVSMRLDWLGFAMQHIGLGDQ